MEKTREGTAEPGIVTGWAVSKISKSNLRQIIHSQVEAYRDPSWITSRDNEQQSISFKNALAKIDGCPNQARGLMSWTGTANPAANQNAEFRLGAWAASRASTSASSAALRKSRAFNCAR